jgi:hypothetical protein
VVTSHEMTTVPVNDASSRLGDKERSYRRGRTVRGRR